MSTTATRFEQLLSARAQIGYGRPGAWGRVDRMVQYEFGGGLPDPGSFPHDAHARRDRPDAAARSATTR